MKLKPSPTILISRPDFLGDCVLATALIKPLKKAYPNSKLLFLAQKAYHPILKDIPEIDEVIEDPFEYALRANQIPEVIKFSKLLKSKNIDCFLGLWENPRYGIAAALANIPVRIGHRYGLLNRITSTHFIKLDHRNFLFHQLEWNLKFLEALDIEPENPEPYLAPSPEAKESLLKRYPQLENNPFAIFHVGAKSKHKRLPIQNYKELLNTLETKIPNDIELICCLTTKETLHTAKILQNQNPNIILVEDTTIQELVSLINLSKLYIGTCTGPIHIAAACKTPTIDYFIHDIQDPLKWGPWKTGHIILSNIKSKDPKYPISINAFEKALTQLLTHQESHSTDQRTYWLEQGLSIGIIGQKSDDFKQFAQGHYNTTLIKNKDLFSLKDYIHTNKINCLVFTEYQTPLLDKATQIIGSNVSMHYPIRIYAPTPEELEIKLQKLSSTTFLESLNVSKFI